MPPPSPAGTLFYAVAYDSLLAPYGASQLAFGPLVPPSSAVVSANPAAFLGGLVANGSVAVAEAGRWVTVRVQPPCVGALCQHSLYALQGAMPYRVYLVAVDGYGSADPAPAVAAFTTAPATAAPALLPPSGPANVTDSGFGVAVSTDAAGAAYFLLVTPKPGAAVRDARVAPGQWRQLEELPDRGQRRRRLAGVDGAALGAVSSWPVGANIAARGQQRALLQESSAVAPGSLVAPTCYPANRTCSLAPADAFASLAAQLSASYDVVTSVCLPVPAAGQPLSLPAFSGLQNNTLFYLLLATEDRAVPQPLRLQPPAVYAVRTVDLSAPQLACGFPTATNITATGFLLSAMLTKPGASVFYVVLPAAAAASAPPLAADVLRGTASGGGVAAAAGNLTRWGALPWEGEPAGGGGDARKLWAPVGGLQGGGNYTAFFAVTLDGTTPAPGDAVVALRCAPLSCAAVGREHSASALFSMPLK